ncbi:MAG: HD domain-containing phosphohydrolase [Oxalobacteraceae bacterium]
MAAGSGDARALPRALARLPLSAQMAFKLTVTKQQHPHLFHHLLLVTVIAHYLAVRGKLSGNDLDRMLCAALFHDLGELHTDPAVLNATHHLSEIEWRHIYVHPITGYLIAREAVELDPAVPIAILQHHERLDGSGYPYGLRGAQIGSLARIISVADVCASIFARFGSNERLSALMRLNRQKYDPELLALAHEGFARPASRPAVAEIAALPRLKAVAQLLETWGKLHAAWSGTGGNSPPGELEFLFERMADLRSMLLQFGFDPERSQLLVALAEAEPQVANELAAALDEIHWQFTDLERETSRHRETIRAVLSADENRLLDGWIAELLAYVAAP